MDFKSSTTERKHELSLQLGSSPQRYQKASPLNVSNGIKGALNTRRCALHKLTLLTPCDHDKGQAGRAAGARTILGQPTAHNEGSGMQQAMHAQVLNECHAKACGARWAIFQLRLAAVPYVTPVASHRCPSCALARGRMHRHLREQSPLAHQWHELRQRISEAVAMFEQGQLCKLASAAATPPSHSKAPCAHIVIREAQNINMNASLPACALHGAVVHPSTSSAQSPTCAREPAKQGHCSASGALRFCCKASQSS